MRVHSSRQQGEISRLFVSKFLGGPYYTDLPYVIQCTQTINLFLFKKWFIAGCPYIQAYFTMGRPFLLPQNCPFLWGMWTPHLIHGSLSPPESSTQMASRSVEPVFYRAHYCNRPTDRATRSVTIGRIYVHTGTVCSKKVDHQPHGLSNLNRFSKFFHCQTQ